MIEVELLTKSLSAFQISYSVSGSLLKRFSSAMATFSTCTRMACLKLDSKEKEGVWGPSKACYSAS